MVSTVGRCGQYIGCNYSVWVYVSEEGGLVGGCGH